MNMILTFSVSIKVSSKDGSYVFQPCWLNYASLMGCVTTLHRRTTEHSVSCVAVWFT